MTFYDIGIDTKGRATGQMKTRCPQCSGKRTNQRDPSLSVDIDNGIFNCHYCSWKGTINETTQRRYVRPTYSAQIDVTRQLMDWFKARHISETTVNIMEIGQGMKYLPGAGLEVDCIQFPFKRGEEVINIKYRGLESKSFAQEKDAERIFFGLQMLEGGTEAIITEGEIDQLSFVEVGIHYAISVPDGGLKPTDGVSNKKLAFLENSQQDLAHIEKFILALDDDENGRGMEAELARRLGKERCWRVRWPNGCKDANEVLMTCGHDALRLAVNEAEPWPIEGVLRVRDFLDEFLTLRDQPGQVGFSTGWRSLDPYYKVRAGQVTIVTGVPSSGKSEFIDALMVNLAREQDWIFGICSLENDPIEHATKLAPKYSKIPYRYGPSTAMDSSQLADAAQWIDDHFRFYSTDETIPSIAQTLDVMRQLILQYGVNGVVLDPWGDFDHGRKSGQTETEYVSQELIALRRFAKRHDVHIWLIAHPKKMETKTIDNEPPVPTPYDISGSAHFFNKADACLAIHRPSDDETVEVYVQKIRISPLLGKKGMVTLVWNKVNTCYEAVQAQENSYGRE